MSRLVGLLVILGALGACGAPRGPAGHERAEIDALDDEAPEMVASLSSVVATRTLVVGALDDLTIQPVGGAYDDGNLVTTYFGWSLEPILRSELRGAFGRAGIRAFEDSLDLAIPPGVANMRTPSRPRGLVVLRGTIDRFCFLRSGRGPRDLVVGELTLRLQEDATGELLWTRAVRVAVRPPRALKSDAFARFAEAVAAELVADPSFVPRLNGGAR